jgi:hypothetical protein
MFLGFCTALCDLMDDRLLPPGLHVCRVRAIIVVLILPYHRPAFLNTALSLRYVFNTHPFLFLSFLFRSSGVALVFICTFFFCTSSV